MTPKLSTNLSRLLIAALVAASYANSIDAQFTFDDWHVIQENPAVHRLSEIPRYFSDPTLFSILEGNRDYRPIFLTSMALAWWAGDGSPLPFHLVSIVLHLVNALLLFELVRRLASLPGGMRPSLSRETADRAGLIAASLFAVHPLATESVVYISSQSVPLVAAFYLSSFLLFLAGQGGEANAPRTKRLRILAPLAYIAALLSKPIAITLPLNLLLWDLVFGPRLARSDFSTQEGRARLARRCVKHVSFAAISVAYVLLRARLFDTGPGSAGPAPRPYFDHFLTQTRALVFYYLEGVVFPFDLSVDRQFDVSTSLADPMVLAAIAILALLGAVLFRLRAQRTIVFWSIWFPVCLLLTTYALVMGQLVNEHRVYLSLAGACAVVGTLGAAGLARLPLRISDLAIGPRTGAAVLLALWVGATATLGVATHLRNRDWRSELALWETAATRSGTYRAHMNYARALEAANRPTEALEEFQRAVELGSYAYPHMNLGLAYLRRDQDDRGLAHLRTAVRLWPSSPETHYFYAYGLEKTGDLATSRSELRKALELRPHYPRAQTAMDRVARTLADDHEVGDDAGLIARYEQRIEQNPEAANTLRFDLAFQLQSLKRDDEAVPYYEEVLRHEPSHRQAHFNLAYSFLHSGDPERIRRSLSHFDRVIELDSTYTEVLFHLASAHRALGDARTGREWDLKYLEAGTDPGLLARAQARLDDAPPPQR